MKIRLKYGVLLPRSIQLFTSCPIDRNKNGIAKLKRGEVHHKTTQKVMAMNQQ
jgi:hypothetical protein